MLALALQHAAAGFPVFPLNGKKPLFSNAEAPGGFKIATTDPAQIREWWSLYPSANIGIAIPEGMAVVDVDPRNGGSLEALPEIPPTRIARTGGGGWHVWFRLDPALVLPGTLWDGIEGKTGGRGYVVAPGSIHPETGQPYEWQDDTPIAPAPAWLVERARPRMTSETVAVDLDASERTQSDNTIQTLAALIAPHYVKGQRHNLAKNLGGWLKQRGWSAADVAAVVGALPSEDPAARVKAALAAFEIAQPFGWTELCSMLGEQRAREIAEWCPNPAREFASIIGQVSAQHLAERATAARQGEQTAIQWVDAVAGSAPLPPVPYVIAALDLCPGSPALVAGYGFSGKTVALQSMALSIASGTPVWGAFEAERGPVAHLDYEQGRRLTWARYQRLANGLGIELSGVGTGLRVATFPALYMDMTAAENELVRAVDGCKLAIIDSLRAAAPSRDENSSDVRRELDMLARVSERTDCAFVVVHHARKPTKDSAGGARMAIRGSGAIYDGCNSVLVFDGAKGRPTLVTHEKARVSGVPADDFHLGISDVSNGFDDRWGLRVAVVEGDEIPLTDLDLRVLERVREHPGLSGRQIASLLDIDTGSGRQKVSASLDRLQVRRLIRRTDGPAKSVLWFPADSEIPPASKAQPAPDSLTDQQIELQRTLTSVYPQVSPC